MKEKKITFKYPDDDGLHTRPWIVDGDERCRTGCARVMGILSERTWVYGDVIETKKDGADDMRGVDMFVPIDDSLMAFLGLVNLDFRGVPFQIKSSIKSCREFVYDREINRIFDGAELEKKYYFVLNGTDAKEMIEADIVGQIVALAKRRGISEEETLLFLAEDLGDYTLVDHYLEQKVILKERAWYLNGCG